jgi:SAM-dependent methyltransferase
MVDLYSELARYYDSENADFDEDLNAYEVLVARFGGPALDIGCGTGRVALHLAASGIDLLGIDTSETMLERARSYASEKGGNAARITWQQVDVRAFESTQRFGLAIFAFSGFMHLLDHIQQIKALRQIGAHLKPEGGLVLDLANPLGMFRAENTDSLIVERLFTDAETGDTVMQQSLATLDPITQVMTLTWVYDRIAPDGLVHRALMPQQVRYTLASELSLLLDSAGFGKVEMYGDYEFNAYEEDSPRLFVVATRTGSDSL